MCRQKILNDSAGLRAVQRMLVVAVGVAITVLASGCAQYFTFKTAQEVFNNTVVDNIDFHSIKDGTYTGYCDMILVNALVRVTVLNGAITDIDLLEHFHNGKDKYDGSKVIDRIIEKQSLTVDCISGATYSSRTILKATQRALLVGSR